MRRRFFPRTPLMWASVILEAVILEAVILEAVILEAVISAAVISAAGHPTHCAIAGTSRLSP